MPLPPEASGPTWVGPRLCPTCEGAGLITDDAGRRLRWCPVCDGAGLIDFLGRP